MKLLYCQLCNDIVAPSPEPNAVRWCRCNRHAVWWHNPFHGIIRVHDKEGPTVSGPAKPYNIKAFLLGITNMFLEVSGTFDAQSIDWIIKQHDENYLFRTMNSCIVRFRPGETSDSAWAELPGTRKPPDDEGGRNKPLGHDDAEQGIAP